MRNLALAILLLLAATAAAQAPATRPDPWARLRFLVGDWTGTATGEPGEGTVTRRYEFILGGKFLYERNTSTYPPQEKNKEGETHEHWSILSYDKARHTFIFRQFHQEGFVNEYALDDSASTPAKLVFAHERIENIKGPWRARETYDIISPDEFIETFELAPLDQPYAVYTRNHFTRAGK